MNILDIKYCAQDLRFEENAYKNFETYEQELKGYFLDQPDGSEIFEDLKLRICEMLQSKMKISGEAISETDVVEIKKSIGNVKQLEEDTEGEEIIEQEPQVAYRDKKLYRSENDKTIAGVCAGLGNYFSIDPLAFRILFILVALFSKGIGVITYIILWIALKPKELPANLSKRLYRNSADEVIGGVCGGLATFFNTESWIVRMVFLSPIILNVVTSSLFDFDFSIFNGSAMGFAFMTYIVLWITTKETESPSEELMARGEDITINSISEETERVHANPDKNSGFNNVLRVIAFLAIGAALIFMFTLLLALVFGSVFMMPLTGSILHTSGLQWLGGLSVVFFLLLPFVAILVWAIRRIAGIKGPSKTLRTSFGGLWALGFVASILLTFFISAEFHGFATIKERIDLPIEGNTLRVAKLNQEGNEVKASFGNRIMQTFYDRDETAQYSNMVDFKQRTSEDNTCYMVIEKKSQGTGDKDALRNAKATTIKYRLIGNSLKFNKYVSLPKNKPFRFQRANVTIYTPPGVELIADPDILKSKKRKDNVKITSDWDAIDESTKEKIEESIEDAMNEVGKALEKIGENMKDLDINIEKEIDHSKEIDLEIEKAEKESEAKIKLEKQRLKLRKEQMKLDELKRQYESERNVVE